MFLYLHVVNADGTVNAEKPYDAVTEHTLNMIAKWRSDGIEMDDVIDRLRAQTVPAGYPIHSWIAG